MQKKEKQKGHAPGRGQGEKHTKHKPLPVLHKNKQIHTWQNICNTQTIVIQVNLIFCPTDRL